MNVSLDNERKNLQVGSIYMITAMGYFVTQIRPPIVALWLS